MTDILHADPRRKAFATQRSIESRLIFGCCYLLFLCAAIARRLLPSRSGSRESIFREAASAASILVGSSFMGL